MVFHQTKLLSAAAAFDFMYTKSALLNEIYPQPPPAVYIVHCSQEEANLNVSLDLCVANLNVWVKFESTTRLQVELI